MAKPSGVWGIDIGQCALKALRLEMIDGKPTATAFDYIEHAKILSQPDADPDALTREALEKFLSRNQIKADQVAISIPGQSGLARFVKLPPVEEKRIPEIVKFEAKQQIPFPLDEVVWDYQKVAGGENVGGFAMETEIGLFAMKRDIISRHIGHYQTVKAEVHTVQMSPLALCNYVTYETLKKGGPDEVPASEESDDTPRGKRRCAVVLDIGTDSSNLIITDGGKIIWQRPVPLGGNNFTRALTKELKLTFAKAEHLKRNAAKSPDLAQILKALRPVLTDFVGEVQRSLGYFTNTHRDAHVAFLVALGSAFKLPGLQKYLSEKLALEVRKPNKFERIYGDTVLSDPVFSENILTFPVAYGLALQGLTAMHSTNHARLMTNLLPQEIRIDRIIRAKKPWAAAAAAALLLGIGAVAIGYGKSYAALTDPAISNEQKTGENAVKQVGTRTGEISKLDGGVATGKKDVENIIMGNKERLDLLRVYEMIHAAAPRPGRFDKEGVEIPGTSNLTLPEQRPYWIDQKYRDSFKKHLERIAEGVPPARLFDNDLSDNLPTVNIEGIEPRYTDNVQQFLENAQKYAQKNAQWNIGDDLLDERKDEQSGKTFPAEREKSEKGFVPKATGGGWVFEIRGYTYFTPSEAPKFLRTCFMKNLRSDRLKSLLVPAPDGSGKLVPLIDKDNAKVKSIIPDAGDALRDRISHVFLCIADSPNNAKAGNTGWRFIGNSQLDTLLQGAAPTETTTGSPMGSPAPMGVPMGGTTNPTASSASKFRSILTSSGGGTNTSGVPMVMGEGPSRGPGVQSGPTGPAVNENGRVTTKLPTEFIIYFVWHPPGDDK